MTQQVFSSADGTPLNATVGFSDLLAEGTPGQLNDKQKRFVNHR